MAESPVPEESRAPEQAGAEEAAPGSSPPEQEPEPEGPDLSSLGPESRELLNTAMLALGRYEPQPGTLSDLPQLTVERQHVLEVCRAMKDDERIGAKMLLCLAALDFPPASGAPAHGRRPAAPAAEAAEEPAEDEPEPVGKLQVVYFLQSLEPERTLVLKTDAPYDDPVLPSVTSVWRAADWYEREAHDLYGIDFEGHPDLAPLLLYDDFEGYPGRRDFPFNEYREF